jgi:hypothetical protein
MQAVKSRVNSVKLPVGKYAVRRAVFETLELRQLFDASALLERVPTESLRPADSLNASLTAAPTGPTANVGTALYNSNGFEPTRFQPGNLVGQDPVQGPWVKFGAPEVSIAASGGTVQSGVAQAGTQSLRIDRLNGQDVRFAPFRATPTNIGETLRIAFNLRVDAAPGAQPFGPFIGVEAYGDNGTGGPARLIGSVGIDAKTGEILVQQAGTGNLITTTAPAGDYRGTFHSFFLDLDYPTQTYRVFLDANPIPIYTGGFVDGTVVTPITNFSDADFSALAAAPDPASQAATGTGYIDNYRISLRDSGTTLYDSKGFEQPRFAAGDITGQDPANGPWVRFGSPASTPADATVQSAVADQGSNALRVERNDGQDERFGPYRELTTVNEQVDIEWRMRVDPSAGPQAFGPFFGVEANNQEADGSVRLIGSGGVDAKTGEILFQRAGTGFIDAVPAANVPAGFNPANFNSYRLELNFILQEYSLFVNNFLVVQESFVDGTAANPIKGFSDADISALAAGADAASQNAQGVAYFDNYKISLPDDNTVLYDSQGFEGTRFTAGDVVGQDPAQGPWQQFSGRNTVTNVATTLTGTANVQTAVVNNGVQAVRVDRQNGFDARWAPFQPHETIQDAVQVDWTMRVEQSVGPQPFGPFFGIQAYSDNGTGGPVRLIGSAGMDAKTGEILYQQAGSGNLEAVPGQLPLAFGTFNTFRLMLDFDRQRYQLYVNNNLVLTEPFVDATAGNPILGFSDADIAALAASGDAASQAANGTAYFDNYAVSAVNAPVVENFIVDDGGAQRSKVRSLTVKFDQPVTVTPGAFTLSRLNSGGSGLNNNSAPTNASAALGTPTSADGLTYVIPILPGTAFSNANGSLEDGIYTLNLVGNNINNSSAQPLPGNQSLAFHRLFGDIDGSKRVNATDYNAFRNSFGATSIDPAYNQFFDINDSGRINAVDYNEFRNRFGKIYTY